MSDGNGALPEGWEQATIEELCALNPKHESNLPDDTEVSFVPMAAVSDVLGTITDPQVRPFGEVRKGYTHFADGDVIFAKITPCMENGKAASVRGMTNGLACGTTEFYVFRSHGAVDQDYLYRFIRQESYRKAARAQMQSGVGQARVPKDFVLSTTLPVPPLAEQGRIVSKIESFQTRSSRARVALSEVGPLLDQFRQSVLRAAFSGRLTADWRSENPDVEPASDLLSRIRKERRERWEQEQLAKYEAKDRTPPKNWQDKYKEPEPVDESELDELPKGWCWTTFETLTESFDHIRIPLKLADRDQRSGHYPYYGASGIIDDIDDFLFDGDFLLIGEDGANLLARSTPIAFLAHGKFWVNNHAHVSQTLADVRLEYLEAFINGISLQRYVTGSAQPKLTQKNLNRIPIALAPLNEHEPMLQKIEASLETEKSMVSVLDESESSLTELDQSILAKAFRGELVPQDPRDEPASELLKRIREKRAAAEP